jgi:pantoate--beta-alanine ligase
MDVFRTIDELRSALPINEQIGFVPTMGALHEGHVSLIKRSAAENPVTVLSIFVNPTQFGPNEDLASYPRTFENDLELAKRSGANFVFAPTPDVIYPPGWSTFIEVQGLTDVLCGKFRPGHFRGVATVVYRLFRIVEPTTAYFGQKDLQQCLVIQKLVDDLELEVKIEICPTLRESDGLAMSSRNRNLNPEERKRAIGIFRALQTVKSWKQKGVRRPSDIVAAAKETLARVPEFRIQYAEIRDLANLQELSDLDRPAAFFVAGYLGNTRLIDNIIF